MRVETRKEEADGRGAGGSSLALGSEASVSTLGLGESESLERAGCSATLSAELERSVEVADPELELGSDPSSSRSGFP